MPANAEGPIHSGADRAGATGGLTLRHFKHSLGGIPITHDRQPIGPNRQRDKVSQASGIDRGADDAGVTQNFGLNRF